MNEDEIKYRDPEENLWWTRVAICVMRDPTLSPSAKALYVLLRGYADTLAKAWPGAQALATCMNCSLRKITKDLAELTDKGLITRERRIGRSWVTIIEKVAEIYRADSIRTAEPIQSAQKVATELYPSEILPLNQNDMPASSAVQRVEHAVSAIRITKEKKLNESWELVQHFKKVRLAGIEVGDGELKKLLNQAKGLLGTFNLDDLKACIDYLNEKEWWGSHEWTLAALGKRGMIVYQKFKQKQPGLPGTVVDNEPMNWGDGNESFVFGAKRDEDKDNGRV